MRFRRKFSGILCWKRHRPRPIRIRTMINDTLGSMVLQANLQQFPVTRDPGLIQESLWVFSALTLLFFKKLQITAHPIAYCNEVISPLCLKSSDVDGNIELNFDRQTQKNPKSPSDSWMSRASLILETAVTITELTTPAQCLNSEFRDIIVLGAADLPVFLGLSSFRKMLASFLRSPS